MTSKKTNVIKVSSIIISVIMLFLTIGNLIYSLFSGDHPQDCVNLQNGVE